MSEAKLDTTPKSDVIFKILFGNPKHPNLLISLLNQLRLKQDLTFQLFFVIYLLIGLLILVLNLNHMKEDMNIMAILISAFLMFIGV